MYRLKAIGIDVAAEAVIVMPLFLMLLRKRLLQRRSRTGNAVSGICSVSDGCLQRNRVAGYLPSGV